MTVTAHHARLGKQPLAKLCCCCHLRQLNSMRLQGATRTDPGVRNYHAVGVTLASGDDAEASYWIRVTDSGGREPLGNQTLHQFPPQLVLLAAASQNLHPHPTDFLVKGTDARPIQRNSEVADVP
jgi:hypothetical protein